MVLLLFTLLTLFTLLLMLLLLLFEPSRLLPAQLVGGIGFLDSFQVTIKTNLFCQSLSIGFLDTLIVLVVSGVFPSPHPRYKHASTDIFLSRIGFSIATARRFASNFMFMCPIGVLVVRYYYQYDYLLQYFWKHSIRYPSLFTIC